MGEKPPRPLREGTQDVRCVDAGNTEEGKPRETCWVRGGSPGVKEAAPVFTLLSRTTAERGSSGMGVTVTRSAQQGLHVEVSLGQLDRRSGLGGAA